MNKDLLKGIFLASRVPNLLIIALSQILATSMLKRHDFEALLNFDVLLLVLSTMLVAAGGYIINDYYDAKIDMVNRPDQVVVGRLLSRRKAIISHIIVSALAVVLGFMISLKVALLHMTSIFLLWYYSNYVRRFFIGKIVIAILAAMALLAVGFTFEIVSYRLMAFAVFAGTIIWIRELVKDLENIVGETQFGVESVPSVWGIRGTKNLILAISIIGLIALVYFIFRIDSKPFTLFYLSLSPVILLFAYILYRSDRRDHFRRLRHLINFFIIVGLLSMLVV